MTTIVFLPDFQVPYQDKRAVAALQQFVADYQPDKLICVGDEADSPEPSRWNKGTAGEYAGTLQKGLDETHQLMAGFRDALGDKPFHVMRSNHGDRIQNYVRRYAPALDSLRSLAYEQLLGYDELDIQYHTRMYNFARGWAVAHGDEGNLIRTPGGTALGLAKRAGVSVICGHTHKLGIQHDHSAYNGRTTRTLFGVEVGHMMDLKKAGYLKTGGANWQAGFGIGYIDSKGNMTPVTIPVIDGRFTVEGEEYKC